MSTFLIILNWLAWLSLILASIFFVACVLLYRLSTSKLVKTLSGKVFYKMIDIDFSTRDFFESTLGNRKVRIVDGPALYVDKADWAKLWVESPLDMAEKNYTFEISASAKPLLFGGYGKATILSINKVSGEADIQK